MVAKPKRGKKGSSQAVNHAERNDAGDPRPEDDGGYVGHHHAERRSQHDPEEVLITGGEGDRGQLGFIAHFGKKEEDEGGAPHTPPHGG